MFKAVRAAASAAAFLAFAVAAASGGALQANAGDAAPVTVSYTDHGTAAPADGDLGLNDPGASVAAFNAAVGEHAGLAALDARVAAAADFEPRGSEEDCLANAVYFEARGESLEGQLAVAEVVLNRAASGRYPATYCDVVRQPAQFSFVHRGGVIPRADRASEAWRKAVAIARIAEEGAVRVLPQSVLWYHANYVAPRWRHRLAQSARIGLHIFYS